MPTGLGGVKIPSQAANIVSQGLHNYLDSSQRGRIDIKDLVTSQEELLGIECDSTVR